jgi:hypothetical protein
VNFEDKEYLEEKEEIEGLENPDEDESDVDILEHEVISYVGNFSLLEYSNQLDKDFIKPEFQRNDVWDRKAKSKLIESFLASYPVPPIFLFKEKRKEEYKIIDGFQRLTTIQQFFKGDFKLIVKNKDFHNKSFKELSEDAQKKLSKTFLNCVIIREIAPSNDTFLYNVFERLNTGGKKLNGMETRRAISYGELIKSLENLNTDPNWRKIINKPEIDNRFLDLELILRLFAFYKDYNDVTSLLDSYSNMRTLLNKYTSECKNNEDPTFIKIFKNVCQSIVEELGNNPFKYQTKRPNYVILDSVMGALLLLAKQGKEVNDLKSKFEALKQNGEYLKYCDDKSGIGTPSKVNRRLNLALEAFQA